MNFSRCAMSRSVIGAPLTRRTICCARAGKAIVAATTRTAIPAASPANCCRNPTLEVTNSSPCHLAKALASPSRPLARSTAVAAITRTSVLRAHRSQGIRPEGAQTKLQHDGVVSDRSRHCRVRITAQPVYRQHEAIVDIADAEPRLVETIVLDIIARRAKQDPIGRQLQRCTSKEAFASREESEERLGRVIAIQELQGPALKI